MGGKHSPRYDRSLLRNEAYQCDLGRSQQEDLAAMIEKYPLTNEYWADKRAKCDRIQCPAYIVASYSTCLHTPGTLRGFEDIKHDRKW